MFLCWQWWLSTAGRWDHRWEKGGGKAFVCLYVRIHVYHIYFMAHTPVEANKSRIRAKIPPKKKKKKRGDQSKRERERKKRKKKRKTRGISSCITLLLLLSFLCSQSLCPIPKEQMNSHLFVHLFYVYSNPPSLSRGVVIIGALERLYPRYVK